MRRKCSSSSLDRVMATKLSTSILGKPSGTSYPKQPSSSRVVRARVSTSEPPNPNPLNYKIDFAETIGKFLILIIIYPDCTNYEGKKIVVYKDVKLEALINQGAIDPHFCNNTKYSSPIARFVPTKEGLAMARTLAKHY